MELASLTMSEIGSYYVLKSLAQVSENINVADKPGVFYREIERYDGGRRLNEFLSLLKKIKKLGSTEFDRYWSQQ